MPVSGYFKSILRVALHKSLFTVIRLSIYSYIFITGFLSSKHKYVGGVVYNFIGTITIETFKYDSILFKNIKTSL